MHRRAALLGLLTGCLGVAASTRRAFACGSGAELQDEEYLDEHGASGPMRELARHWVGVTDDVTPLPRRLSVAPDGQFYAVSDRDAGVFRIFGPSGATGTVSAPQGGTATFLPSSRALLLYLDNGAYKRVVLVNPVTAEHEPWGDFLHAHGVALGPGGVLVSHALMNGGAAVTLVLGNGRIEELARGERPGVLATRGNRVAVFEGERAKVFDMEERRPHDLGALPSAATRAVWTRDGLLAVCDEGLYALGPGHRPRRVLAEPGIHTLFAQGNSVVAASKRRAWSVAQAPRVILQAPRANLTQVSAIPDSDDLLVVRGAGVRRLSEHAGLGGVVARGREGFHLRGAVAHREGIVTWSARRWLVTEGGGCSPTSLPSAYLID